MQNLLPSHRADAECGILRKSHANREPVEEGQRICQRDNNCHTASWLPLDVSVRHRRRKQERGLRSCMARGAWPPVSGQPRD